MTEINELLNYLKREVPMRYMCDWDNSGLQVGHGNKYINKIMIALDATEQVVYDACTSHCDFILTHHPLFFSGIKHVTADEAIGRKLYMLIGNDIAVYSMHTNFDAMPGGMGDLAAGLLQLQCQSPLEPMNDGLEDPWGIGVVGNLPVQMTLADFCEEVKTSFGLSHVNLFAAGDMDTIVSRVAICPGSGKSLINLAKKAEADVYLTGDIGHHDGIDCVDMGMTVIDAGHFGLEKIFVPFMANKLKEQFPELEIVMARAKAPFKVV